MSSRFQASVLLLLVLVFIVGLGAGATGASATPPGGIDLQRVIESTAVSPGETVHLQFEITNHEAVEVSYTLVDEMPVEATLLESGGGVYNQTAGFVVWRGTLAPGEQITIPYALQVQGVGPGVLPLYAYMSTSSGAVLEQTDQLQVISIPWRLALSETLVQTGQAAMLLLQVSNPFARTLSLDLAVDVAGEVELAEALPTSVQLAPYEDWAFETRISATTSGSHAIRATPQVAGVAAAGQRQATLTAYEGEPPRAPKETLANEVDARPIQTEQVHEVRIPSHLLKSDEELLLVARIPAGAGYLPATAVVDDTAVTPQISGEYLLIPLPLAPKVTVRYMLRYEDRSMMSGRVPNDGSDVGVVSLGLVPRVLQGDEQLLYALHAETSLAPRERVGAVILDPFDGQVYTEREQIDIEVDAPTGANTTLRVNGAEISRSQIGGVATDPFRHAEKYIAIPLRIGANHLEFEAHTVDGDRLVDSITVYRSGPVTQIVVNPVTELVTGRVQPLLVQVAATDRDGLPPADRTPITVGVEGARLLTKDAHPDWVGHQVLLYGGRALLQIEPPSEATTLTITAQSGDVSEEARLVVAARADDWFLMSLGTLRIDGLLGSPNTQPSAHGALRLVARGPVGNAVLTAAIDSLANPSVSNDPDLWTGDTSTRGYLVGSGVPVHLQLERDLSYVRYGSGRVDFAGELARYNRTHTGIQSLLQVSPRLTVSAFIDREPVDRLEHIFEGDGTGYYRLPNGSLSPHSEDLAVIAREPFFPYDVVSERTLRRSDYTIDYRTGQIWLYEPLLSRDDDGNHLSLRVRYHVIGEQTHVGVGGLQATLQMGQGRLRATARLARDPYGAATHLAVLGGEHGRRGGAALTWEAGLARREAALAKGYAIGVSHPSLWGWNVRLSHRHVEGDFASAVDSVQQGVVTSFAGERRLWGARLSARTAVQQDRPGQPWTSESVVSTDWSWGRLRPSLGVTVRNGESAPLSATLDTGVGVAMRMGSVNLSRATPLVGEPEIHEAMEGRIHVARGLDVLFSLDREIDGKGTATTRNAISVTKALEGRAVSTVLKGGYESPGAGESAGAMVYSATSRWPVNEASTVELAVGHRRPLAGAALPSFGGRLGWTYKHHGGDTEFRLDRRSDGNGVKQSIQLRRYQPVNEDLAFSVDASVTHDSDTQMRGRLSLNAAYRTGLTAVFGSIAFDRSDSPAGDRQSLEWRVKAAHHLTSDLRVHMGYAQRVTERPTRTDKLALGTSIRLSDRSNLLFEGSLLRQHDSLTDLRGSMVGIEFQLVEDVWLTVGYAADHYVGFDAAGSGFARRRSGAFIELNVAFDELSPARWFGKGRE